MNLKVERMRFESMDINVLYFVFETGGRVVCFEEVGMRWVV